MSLPPANPPTTVKLILCLDFDGVIHSYSSPWTSAIDIPDPPVPGALAFIRAAQAAGFVVAVFSSRSATEMGRRAMAFWLQDAADAEVAADPLASRDMTWLGAILWPETKPPAFLSIDDRAILFTGPPWPDPQALLRFRPWNK